MANGVPANEKATLNAAVVTAPFKASAIEADRLRMLAEELPHFRAPLLRYQGYIIAQLHQTAACNAVHLVEQRICRWLLRMFDLTGPDLLITQEDIGEMIGARRSSVTTIAGELQKAGIISYSRGHIHIADVGKLESRACGCATELRAYHRLLFG